MRCKALILSLAVLSGNLYSNFSLKLTIGAVYLKHFGDKTKTQITQVPTEISYSEIILVERGYAKLTQGNGYAILSNNTATQIEDNITLQYGSIKLHKLNVKFSTFKLINKSDAIVVLNRQSHSVIIKNLSGRSIYIRSTMNSRYKKRVRPKQAVVIDLIKGSLRHYKKHIDTTKFLQPLDLIISNTTNIPLRLRGNGLKTFKTKILD